MCGQSALCPPSRTHTCARACSHSHEHRCWRKLLLRLLSLVAQTVYALLRLLRARQANTHAPHLQLHVGLRELLLRLPPLGTQAVYALLRLLQVFLALLRAFSTTGALVDATHAIACAARCVRA